MELSQVAEKSLSSTEDNCVIETQPILPSSPIDEGGDTFWIHS